MVDAVAVEPTPEPPKTEDQTGRIAERLSL